MGSCVLRETIRKGRPRFAPRVSLSVYLFDLRVDPAGYLDRLTETWQKPAEGSRSTVRVSIVVGCG
jgi:hypothetical protein